MMLLATLSVLSAAINRIDVINSVYQGTALETIFGPFFAVLALGLIFLIAHTLLTRSLSRPFAIGYGVFLLASLAIMHGSQTSAWDSVATWLLR